VAGWEERRDRPTYADVLVRRHAPDGRLLWSREFDGPTHGNDRAYAVAEDPGGAVFVAGTTSNRTGSSWLVLKYDSKGVIKWGRTCGGKMGLSATARALAVDSDGGVIVAGSEQMGGFDYDWAVRKFDKDGNIVWARTLGGGWGGWDEAHAVAAYRGGGALVAGKVQQGGSGSRYSWQVARFTTDGQVAWSRTSPGPAGVDTRAFAAAVDDCGRAVVAGCIGGIPLAGSGRGGMLAAEYSPEGELLCSWTATTQGVEAPVTGAKGPEAVGASGGETDCIMGAGVDRSGNAFLAGFVITGRGFRDVHALLSRYSRPACPEVRPAGTGTAPR